MSWFKWGKTQRQRAREAVVIGVTQYEKKKPKTMAARWGSIAGIVIGAAVFIHTGNPQLAGMAGNLAGEVTESAIEARAENVSAE